MTVRATLAALAIGSVLLLVSCSDDDGPETADGGGGEAEVSISFQPVEPFVDAPIDDFVEGVQPDDSGWVAWTGDGPDEAGPTLLRSTDGSQWEIVPTSDQPSSIFGPDLLVPVGDRLIGVDASNGYVLEAGADTWTETAPRAWDSIPEAPGPYVLFAAGDGVVALTFDGDLVGGWTSADGVTWEVTDVSFELDENHSEPFVTQVSRTDDGFIAGGYAAEDEWYEGAIWRSVDGLDWELECIIEPSGNGDQNVFVYAVVESDDVVYATGVDYTNEDEFLLWTAEGDGDCAAQPGAHPGSVEDTGPLFAVDGSVRLFTKAADGPAQLWELQPG